MSHIRMDALERYDTQLAAFFSRQLEQIRPTLYEVKFPEFKARRLVPINNSVNLGAESYTTRSISEAGEADWVTDLADDAPEVEVTGAAEDSIKMRSIQASYGWHLQEARAAQFAGLDLSNRKAVAARRAIERKIDQTLLVGATVGGATLQGLFNLSGSQAPIAYTPDVTTFEDETSEDVFTTLMNFVSNIYTNSKEVEQPDTLVLPTTTKQFLMNRRMGDANNSTILKYFLDSQEFIKTIETSHYLEQGASAGVLGHGGASGVKRMMAYRKDPEMLEGFVNEFEQLPPEYRSARVLTICMARVGGIQAHRPKSAAYADGI